MNTHFWKNFFLFLLVVTKGVTTSPKNHCRSLTSPTFREPSAMTQLTFDFTTITETPGCSTSNCTPSIDRSRAFHGRCVQAHSEVECGRRSSSSSSPASEPKTKGEERSDRLTASSLSLSLYDGRRSELKHIGDLAQAVLARYDIVRQRRELRLRREAMRQAAIRNERANPALIAH